MSENADYHSAAAITFRFDGFEAKLKFIERLWVAASASENTGPRMIINVLLELEKTHVLVAKDVVTQMNAGSFAIMVHSLANPEEVEAFLKDTLGKRIAALEDALRNSMTAIDDWLNIYAEDHCDGARVKEAKERVHSHGTLSYIARVQAQNRAAISQPGDSE